MVSKEHVTLLKRAKENNYFVLVIENEVVENEFYQNHTREHQLPYDYLFVNSILEGQHALQCLQFDVIICDPILKDGTIVDLLRYDPELPVIAAVSPGEEDKAVEARNAGAYGYVLKDTNRNYLKTLTMTLENTIELSKARKATELSIEIKKKFLENISHEIRTPLNGIFGMLQLLETTKLTEMQNEYIDLARESADQLIHTVDHILQYLTIDEIAAENRKHEFNIMDMMKNVIQDCESAMDRNTCFYIYHSIQHGVPENLIGDETKIYRILYILAQNALRLYPKKQVALSVEKVSDHSHGVQLKFLVSDAASENHGNQIRCIFDKFAPVNDNKANKTSGPGFDIYTAQTLVQSLGSNIYMKNREKKGYLFYFTLNLEVAKAAENKSECS